MSKFNYLSLKTKMFITFVTAFVVLFSLFGIIIYTSNYNEMKSQTQSLSKVLSTQFTRTVDLYFKDIERLSLIVFTDSVIQDNLIKFNDPQSTLYNDIVIRNEIYSRLFNQMYPRRNIQNISIYTNEDTYFQFQRHGNMEVNHSMIKPEWQQQLDELPKNTLLFLPTHEIPSSSNVSTKVVSIVRNIYNIPHKQKIGSMKIDINIEVFESLLDLENVSDLENYARLFILTDDNAVIYDHLGKLNGLNQINITIPPSNAEQQGERLTWGNNQYIYSNSQSGYTNWNTVILIDDEFLIYERNQIIMFVGLTGIIVILIIALVSYFLSYQISSPLLKMMDRMKQVEKGNLRDRMEFTGNKEMDLLTRVYNNMLNSINKLITEVYELSLAEKTTKISALQSQINPHFLHNTLNVMRSISRFKGAVEVAEISESLSDLFGYSMKNLDKPVMLEKELEHISNYTKIQAYRFGDRYRYITDVSPETKTAYIPKLAIQPLVENAFNHGLSKNKSGGIIQLTTKKIAADLIIQVSDNGIGMNEQKLEEVKLRSRSFNLLDSEEKGIGLINIHQRICLMYGYRYGLEIESEYHQGTTITLRIPFQTDIKEKGMK